MYSTSVAEVNTRRYALKDTRKTGVKRKRRIAAESKSGKKKEERRGETPAQGLVPIPQRTNHDNTMRVNVRHEINIAHAQRRQPRTLHVTSDRFNLHLVYDPVC